MSKFLMSNSVLIIPWNYPCPSAWFRSVSILFPVLNPVNEVINFGIYSKRIGVKYLKKRMIIVIKRSNFPFKSSQIQPSRYHDYRKDTWSIRINQQHLFILILQPFKTSPPLNEIEFKCLKTIIISATTAPECVRNPMSNNGPIVSLSELIRG